MKVVYIMGAGHIGSTILDLVISANSQIESLGEVSKFHHFGWTLQDNRICACGLTVYECQFWTAVRKKWTEMVGSNNVARHIYLQRQFEGSKLSWARLIKNRYKPASEYTEYMGGIDALYSAIQLVSGKEFLVDSSLTPRRAYALTMNPNIDLYLIHLVRDGRGVIWSLKKPGKKITTKEYVPASPWRTIQYWISANVQSTWVYNNVREEKKQRIRYEDFVINPSATLKKIGVLLGKDMGNLVNGSTVNYLDQERHTVAGNRVRMQKDIQIRADFAWMEHLPETDRRLYWLLAGWLARRYGYKQYETDYRL